MYSNVNELQKLSDDELQARITDYSNNHYKYETTYSLLFILGIVLVILDIIFFIELNLAALILTLSSTIIVGILYVKFNKLADKFISALYNLTTEEQRREKEKFNESLAVSLEFHMSRIENQYQQLNSQYIQNRVVTEYNKITSKKILTEEQFKSIINEVNNIMHYNSVPTVDSLKVAVKNDLTGKFAIVTFDGKGYLRDNSVVYVGDNFIDLVVLDEHRIKFIAEKENDSVVMEI